jgi:hypothetical protein
MLDVRWLWECGAKQVVNAARSAKVSRGLARIWFGTVGVTGIVLFGMLVDDWFRGEAMGHFGWAFMIQASAALLLAVGVALLPLLVVAAVLDRKARS